MVGGDAPCLVAGGLRVGRQQCRTGEGGGVGRGLDLGAGQVPVAEVDGHAGERHEEGDADGEPDGTDALLVGQQALGRAVGGGGCSAHGVGSQVCERGTGSSRRMVSSRIVRLPIIPVSDV